MSAPEKDVAPSGIRDILHRIYNGETKIDFIGRRRIWFLLSAAVVLVSVVALLTTGLNYGIEFEGGVQVQASVRDPQLVEADSTEVIGTVRDAIAEFDANDAQIQVTEGDTRDVLVQTKEVTNTAERNRLIDAVARSVGASESETDSTSIGSRWGSEVTAKAVRALIIFLVVVVAFISWRFEWKMAVSAILALVHDLLITAGIYSIVGFEVTPSSVIAILTILGYSLYDTVVVFDKLEENTVMFAATGKMTYKDSANLSLNQVFMRSLNTSLATLLPVATLLFVGAGLLGAGTLEDLALALFVGLLSGTYSSVFFATPILAMLKEREPRYRNLREKVLREARRAQSRPAPAPEPVAVGAAAAASTPEPAARPGAAAQTKPNLSGKPKQPARRPGASKKSKRRKRR